MTDPMETRAPDRVYLDGDATIDEGYWPRCFGTPKPCSEPALEYIRADLVAALVAVAVAGALASCSHPHETHINRAALLEAFGPEIAAAIRARGEHDA